jgi:hypothetical protein
VKKTILLYGLLGGVLITVLKLTEYRFLVVEHSVELYGGLIALLFSVVGIWLGLKLTKTKETVVVREVEVLVPVQTPLPQPFTANAARIRELGITPRELEILNQIAAGLSTREIAAKLFVSEKHSEDPFQPSVRQTRRQTAHAGCTDRQGRRAYPLNG